MRVICGVRVLLVRSSTAVTSSTCTSCANQQMFLVMITAIVDANQSTTASEAESLA
jgi:hypothetical protein